MKNLTKRTLAAVMALTVTSATLAYTGLNPEDIISEVTVSAETLTSGDLSYVVNDKEITITGCSKEAITVVIPDESASNKNRNQCV